MVLWGGWLEGFQRHPLDGVTAGSPSGFFSPQSWSHLSFPFQGAASTPTAGGHTHLRSRPSKRHSLLHPHPGGAAQVPVGPPWGSGHPNLASSPLC